MNVCLKALAPLAGDYGQTKTLGTAAGSGMDGIISIVRGDPGLIGRRRGCGCLRLPRARAGPILQPTWRGINPAVYLHSTTVPLLIKSRLFIVDCTADLHARGSPHSGRRLLIPLRFKWRVDLAAAPLATGSRGFLEFNGPPPGRESPRRRACGRSARRRRKNGPAHWSTDNETSSSSPPGEPRLDIGQRRPLPELTGDT